VVKHRVDIDYCGHGCEEMVGGWARVGDVVLCCVVAWMGLERGRRRGGVEKTVV